jgi:hypothetical protein
MEDNWILVYINSLEDPRRITVKDLPALEAVTAFGAACSVLGSCNSYAMDKDVVYGVMLHDGYVCLSIFPPGIEEPKDFPGRGIPC